MSASYGLVSNWEIFPPLNECNNFIIEPILINPRMENVFMMIRYVFSGWFWLPIKHTWLKLNRFKNVFFLDIFISLY